VAGFGVQNVTALFRNKATLVIAAFYWVVALLWLAIDASGAPYLIGLAIVVTLVLALRTDIIYVAFLLSLMTTSFFSLEITGSYVRLPFILSLFVLLFLPKRVLANIMKSRILLFLAAYVGWTFFATLYNSTDYIDSLRIAGLPILLVFISVGVAGMIASERLPLGYTLGIVTTVAALNLVIGIAQYIGFFGFGANVLNLTEQQWLQISLHHRMTATFWEGDTFGKYLMAFILLMVPLATGMYREKQKGFYIILLAFLVLTLNQTRSAWIGLTAGLSLFVLLGKTDFRKKVFFLSLLVVSASLGYYLITTLEPDTLLRQRTQALASFEKIQQDPSAAFRIKTIENTWPIITANATSFLFGHGFVEMGEDYEGASNIFLHIMVTSGAVGLVFFALSLTALFRYSLAVRSPDPILQHTAKGVALAMVGMLVASQLAPMVIDPIFWMVMGLGIHCEIAARQLSRRGH
jgi:hypothetical protein